MSMPEDGLVKFGPMEVGSAAPERAESELEQFARLVVHDARAPLQVIRERLRQAQPTFEPGDPLEAMFLEKAIAQTEGLLHAANRTLSYAKLGRESGPAEPVDLAALVERAADRVPDDVARIALQTMPLPTVRGFSEVLATALFELFDNAARYAGSECVQVRVQAVRCSKSVWQLCVSDDGSGMSDIDAEHAASLYYRSPHHTARSGAGVGLAIVRKAAALHGGKLSVKSRLNVGTAVAFSLSL